MAMGQVRGRRGRSCQRKARGRQLLQTARQDCGVVDVGECVLTFWVRRRLDHVEESHVGDVVDVYLDFEDDDERLAVELDGEDGGREEELAYHGLPLFVGGVRDPYADRIEGVPREIHSERVIQWGVAVPGNGPRKDVHGVECWEAYIPWC